VVVEDVNMLLQSRMVMLNKQRNRSEGDELELRNLMECQPNDERRTIPPSSKICTLKESRGGASKPIQRTEKALKKSN
jgi:hypothetical protein